MYTSQAREFHQPLSTLETIAPPWLSPARTQPSISPCACQTALGAVREGGKPAFATVEHHRTSANVIQWLQALGEASVSGVRSQKRQERRTEQESDGQSGQDCQPCCGQGHVMLQPQPRAAAVPQNLSAGRPLTCSACRSSWVSPSAKACSSIQNLTGDGSCAASGMRSVWTGRTDVQGLQGRSLAAERGRGR